MQKMCDVVVRREPYSLQFVPDWFVSEEQKKMYGIMTMSIVMMMDLLNGMTIILDEKLKTQK